jgi:hypothetical protein
MFKLTLDPKFLPSDLPAEEWEKLESWRQIMEKAVRDTMKEQIANMVAFGISSPEILEASPSLDPTDFELIALRNELHEVAKLAEQRLKEMPDFDSIADEQAAIDEIMQPGDQIAGRMYPMKPTTPAGVDAKVRAGKWKSGDYIATYLEMKH